MEKIKLVVNVVLVVFVVFIDLFLSCRIHIDFQQYKQALVKSCPIFRKLAFFDFLQFWGRWFFEIQKIAFFRFLSSCSYSWIENRCADHFAFQKFRELSIFARFLIMKIFQVPNLLWFRILNRVYHVWSMCEPCVKWGTLPMEHTCFTHGWHMV